MSSPADKLKCNNLSSPVVTKLASLFKVLGDETRVKIIYALSDGEMCVNEISQILDISQSAVSHQLKQLRLEGLVKTRRDGKNIYYSFDDEHVVDILNQALAFSLAESMVFTFGAGFGFTLVLLVFAAIRERLAISDVPEPFKNTSIALITAGLLSLAFMGFAGFSGSAA